ncbi:hypothetical protein [Mesorhizobium sp.]|uniref:hypothetical protein n=1 Tax=Mesorhizobium sp. TaxID=1871066 RepID=UPI000FD23B1E|nr:hypothetical protein [Mesorhizobium sp.]RVC64476.1 hypothetical protein EN779_01675 [Mesorhizobium sp. M4B.F.Ca.ET.088.02.2.1]RWF28346.1 MAG: hypothetical protein EOS45_22680 [Mesorhizobium sp.]
MKSYLTALFFTVVGGIIIGLFNYTFLRAGPETPTIDIQQRTSAIPVQSAKSLLLPDVTKNSNYFAGVYAVQKFDIKNNGDKIYKDVLFRATNFETVMIEHDGKAENLTGDKQLDIRPGDTITVSGIAQGYESPYGMPDAGKLLVAVGDVAIPIRISAVDEGNIIAPVITFAINSPFTAYIILILLVLCTFITFVVVLSGITLSINPKLKLSYSNKQFAELLGLVNYVNKTDPDRYQEISKLADKFEKAKLPKPVTDA